MLEGDGQTSGWEETRTASGDASASGRSRAKSRCETASSVDDDDTNGDEKRAAGAVSMVPCFMGDTDPLLRRLEPPPDLTADEIFLVTHEVSRQRPAVVAVLAALRRLFRDHRAALEGLSPPGA